MTEKSSFDTPIAPAERRVIGPPGTGKTTWLKGEIEQIAGAYGGAACMVASLTKAAAVEVASRVKSIPGDQVATLHAHCYRALGCPDVVYDRATLKEWNDTHRAGWRLSGGVDLDEGMDALSEATEGDKVMLHYSAWRALGRPKAMQSKDLAAFAEHWEKFKQKVDAIDFQDMIDFAYRDVEEAPGHPAWILCDEAQDMDRSQIALVRKWAKHAVGYVLVGDPAQNLYEFRGTDPEAFYEGDLEPEQIQILSQSYRVPRAIHEVATRWIRGSRSYREAEYFPSPRDGSVEYSDWDPDNFRWLRRSITDVLAEGKTAMVLTACSYQLRPLLDDLRAEGVPFHNPYRIKRGDWNPFRTAHRVRSYLATDEELFGTYAGLWTWRDLQQWLFYVRADGVLRRGAKKEIAARSKSDEENFRITREDAKRLFEDSIELNDLAWLQGRILPSAPVGIHHVIKAGLAHGKHVIKENPRLTVGTIHSVKGGEADVVFLSTGLSQEGWNAWTKGYLRRRDALIRQFYVGITRARERLVILTPTEGAKIEYL